VHLAWIRDTATSSAPRLQPVHNQKIFACTDSLRDSNLLLRGIQIDPDFSSLGGLQQQQQGNATMFQVLVYFELTLHGGGGSGTGPPLAEAVADDWPLARAFAQQSSTNHLHHYEGTRSAMRSSRGGNGHSPRGRPGHGRLPYLQRAVPVG
jgi:hypothetical protein